MRQLVIEGTIGTNQTRLDHGITDLIVHQTTAGPVVFAMSGPTGGLTAYAIGPDGAPSLLDYAHFHHSFALGVMDRGSIITTATGAQLVVAQTLAGQLVSFRLAADGQIGGTTTFNGVARLGNGPRDLDQWSGNTLFLANGGAGSIEAYTLGTTNQLAQSFTANDAQAAYAASVLRLETLSLDGADYLVGASLGDRGVSAYRITPDGLVATGNLGVDEGLGIMAPTALATVQIGARHFVLLGSAPDDGIGQSGAISVMELRQDGSLWPTDHVMDTLHTRFGMIQSLEVITANGFSYVIAAGGDDGATVFVLLPNGRLHLVDSIADRFGIGLDNVTAVAATHGPDRLQLFLASETFAGLTRLSLDISQNGAVLTAPAMGGQITGTARDDIVLGGPGDDLLAGAAGADIIEDGAGRDTLSGGVGRDIFVLRSDGAQDWITDFEPGHDRLDLSEWPFLYDPSGLSILPGAGGATVGWRGETLVIETADGAALTASAILAALVPAPDRMPFFATIWAQALGDQITGTAAADTLVGGDHGDSLTGLAGNDLLDGAPGDDTLNGGAGHDTLRGGAGHDLLMGETGFDLIRGGDGDDTIDGGAQADNLGGDDGDDHIRGGQGLDLLFGGNGDDTLLGGDDGDGLHGQVGNDRIFGENGSDRLFGGHGFDQMFGGDGDDVVNGGIFADGLYGDAGDDWLVGEQGADQLYGGAGDDRLFGGLDADVLRGDDGNDTLWGHEGADRLFGGTGADFARGGPDHDFIDGGDQDDNLGGDDGNDTINGSGGNDLIHGGHGNDLIRGGPGNDTLAGQWGNNSIFGDDGDDIITALSGFDFIRGGTGDDLIDGGSFADNLGGDAGNDTITGGHGRDVLFGGHGNDLLQGGDDDDRVHGQFGRDTLHGGKGDDGLWGGFDGDVFVFADGHGNDTIHDFNARNSLEKIDLSGLSSLTSLAGVLGPGGAAAQVGGHVRIDTGGGNLIWVLNTELADLDASNFVF